MPPQRASCRGPAREIARLLTLATWPGQIPAWPGQVRRTGGSPVTRRSQTCRIRGGPGWQCLQEPRRKGARIHAGTAPNKASLTRFTGLIPPKSLGLDLPITVQAGAQRAVVTAGQYAPWPAETKAPGSSGSTLKEVSTRPARPYHYRRDSGSCSGSSTTVVYEHDGEEEVVADEGCGASSTGTTTSSSCGSTEESSSSSSGERSSFAPPQFAPEEALSAVTPRETAGTRRRHTRCVRAAGSAARHRHTSGTCSVRRRAWLPRGARACAATRA